MVAEVSPLAGKPVDPSMLVNVPRLVSHWHFGQSGKIHEGKCEDIR